MQFQTPRTQAPGGDTEGLVQLEFHSNAPQSPPLWQLAAAAARPPAAVSRKFTLPGGIYLA